MEGLIAVFLRHRKPVTEAFGVGREDIRDKRIHLPAIRFLLLHRRIEDNTDGEKIIDLIHIAMLHLHLMVDGVNGFGPPLDSKGKSLLLQFFLQRGDKGGNIRLALRLLGVQRVRDIFIGVVIKELECQILHFRFDLVQAQTMRHRCVQILGFPGYMSAFFRITLFVQLPEQLQTLIEDRKKHFITIFHRTIIKKRCKFSEKNLFTQVNTIKFTIFLAHMQFFLYLCSEFCANNKI